MKTISSETTFNTDLSDFERTLDRTAGAVRAPVRAAQGQGHRRRHGDAQAQIGRISLAHARPASDDPDATGQYALRHRASSCWRARSTAPRSGSSASGCRGLSAAAGGDPVDLIEPRDRARAAAERAMDRVQDPVRQRGGDPRQALSAAQGRPQNHDRQQPATEEGKRRMTTPIEKLAQYGYELPDGPRPRWRAICR